VVSYDGHMLGFCTVNVWVDVLEKCTPSSLLPNLIRLGAEVIVGEEFGVCIFKCLVFINFWEGCSPHGQGVLQGTIFPSVDIIVQEGQLAGHLSVHGELCCDMCC